MFTIAFLVHAIIVLVILGLVVWLAGALLARLPIDALIKQIINVLIWVIAIFVILDLLFPAAFSGFRGG